jgi:hypothetical protein
MLLRRFLANFRRVGLMQPLLCICVFANSRKHHCICEPIFVKLGMYEYYIMSNHTMLTACFTNPIQQPVSPVYAVLLSMHGKMCPFIRRWTSTLVNTFPRQRIHATVEQFLTRHAAVLVLSKESLWKERFGNWSSFRLQIMKERHVLCGVPPLT